MEKRIEEDLIKIARISHVLGTLTGVLIATTFLLFMQGRLYFEGTTLMSTHSFIENVYYYLGTWFLVNILLMVVDIIGLIF